MRAVVRGLLERWRVRSTQSPTAPSASPGAVFDALVAPLPPVAREEFVRRAAAGGPPARNLSELFETLRGWAIGASLAEGRGGYPGGRGKPDWTDYVKLQQKHVAIFHALVEAFGEPPPALTETFRDFERRFPPPVRRMGEGYEPHVDDWAGRLFYSLPVDCGFVSLSASYPIDGCDLAVLLADPYRRAVLEVVAHVVLQRSMIRGNPEVTEQDFRRVVDAILHSNAHDLEAFVAGIDRDHNASVHHFVEAAMRRRDAKTRLCEGEATCGS